jgi:RHS repeat-associated protein
MAHVRFTWLIFAVAASTSMMAQIGDGPIYTPNIGSSSYAGAAAARSKILNARGSSSPIVAKTGPLHVPRTDTIVGSQSYNDVIPILNLPGRGGLDLTLNLYYNSRIWDVDTVGATVTFNADRDFPSYGFRLDFGYVEIVGGQYIVTEGDGTKHALSVSSVSSLLYDASDGTYLEYNTMDNSLSYKNGTVVYYERFPSQAGQQHPTLWRPIKIKDINGNFITIAYLSGPDKFPQTVTDTLGRVITFNYDQLTTKLTSITQAVQPSTLDPSGVHTYATFSWGNPYTTNQTWYAFSGLAVHDAPAANQITVLTDCTYANGTGYHFTYGDWGIIKKIESLSSTGATRNYVSYNYPLAISGPLTDAPAYTQQTVSPDGQDTNTSVWLYEVTKAGTGIVTSMKVTGPETGSSNVITITNIDQSSGLLSSQQTKDGSGNVLRTVAYTWALSGPATVPATITTTNDTGQQSSVQYTYDGIGDVGNPSDLYEYDFGMVLKRHTVTTYLNWTNLNYRILTLPTRIVIKDGAGNTISRTDLGYDEGSLTSITGASHHDDAGRGSGFTVRGNLTSITRYSNAAAGTGGVTRTFAYDTLGNLRTAQLDCCNNKTFNFSSGTQYSYPDSVVRGPSGLQFTSSFTYNNDKGLLLTSTDENNQVTQYQYDSMNRTTKVILPPQNSTVVELNTAFGDSAASPTVTSSSTSSGNSGMTVTTFDGLGHVMQVDNKDGSTIISSTKTVYDKLWRPTQASNPYAPGETPIYTTFAYDGLSRRTRVTPPSSGYTQYQYLGNTVTITDPAGKQRRNFSDALGRLIEVDEPGWGDAIKGDGWVTIAGSEQSVCLLEDCVSQLQYTYDTGTVAITVNGSTKTASYGRYSTAATIASDLVSQISNDGSFPVTAALSGTTITLTARQAGGNTNYSLSVSSATDDVPDFGGPSFTATRSGATLTHGMDGTPEGSPTLSRPIVTTYAYDAMNNLTSVSLAAMGPVNGVTYAGQPRSYAYDSMGRVTSATTPESGTVTNYYTDLNNQACSGDPSLVCRVQDARGVVKTLAYDNINRPLSVTYSDGTAPVSYSYITGVDRLASITEGPATPAPANSQAFTYDNLGRITSVTQTIDQVPYLTQYTYNLLGQLATITYPSTHVVTQNYDGIGRTSSIVSGGTTYLSGLSYNAAGETLGMALGNGVQGTFAYNDHLQLQSLRYSQTGVTPDVLNLGYDYTSTAQPNNNGQIQAVHYYNQPGVEDTNKSELFTYDAWFRLKAAQTVNVNVNTAGTWSLGWTYDRLGNRLSQSLAGGNVSVGTSSVTIDPATNRINGFSYDSAGNLTGDGTFTYAYDGANRMKQAQQIASPNTVTNSTFFGPFRIKKVVGTTTTRYIYSGSKPIAEYVNGSTTPSKEYIYAGSTLLATIAGTSATYHHPDHLSNRAETDTTGAVVRTFGSFPYGESWYESAADPMKFTTYSRDSGTGESGLDYAVFRHYNSGQGRFMSADLRTGRISAPQSLNRYSYAGGDPMNLIDPLGLEPLTCAPGYTRIYNGNGPGHCVLDPQPQMTPPEDAPARSGGGPKDDCHKFADMVEQIAKSTLGQHPDNPYLDIKNFMDKLVQTFTDRTDATATGMNTPSGHPYATFGSSGFAEPYFEADEVRPDGTHRPSNQVRHATAGLATGFALGESTGLWTANRRENPNDLVHGAPDIHLNNQTVPEGAHIGAGQSGVTGKPGWGMEAAKGLADWIRNVLCAH